MVIAEEMTSKDLENLAKERAELRKLKERNNLEWEINEIVNFDKEKKNKIYNLLVKERAKERYKLNLNLIFAAMVVTAAICWITFEALYNKPETELELPYQVLTIRNGEKEIYSYKGKCEYDFSRSNMYIKVYNENRQVIYEAALPDYASVTIDYLDEAEKQQ